MKSTTRRKWWIGGVHLIRVGVVVALFALLPSPHEEAGRANSSIMNSSTISVPPSERVVELTGGQPLSDSPPDAHGLWAVSGSDGSRVGRSLPDGAGALGYRGPTEALFSVDEKERVTGVVLLDSHDTDEHVQAVESNREFLSQFNGLTWGGVDPHGNAPKIDGVSGATLTSLAMAEGLLLRLGRSTGSLIFYEPLRREEVAAMSPDAGKTFTDSVASTVPDPIVSFRDDRGTFEGAVFRSGEFSDEVIGYQGPTEVLISIDERQRITRVQIRRSFDNQPYVDYVREDDYYWSIWQGMNLDDLATWDPVAEQVEGVSGATMTSMAIAEMLPQVAKHVKASGMLEQQREEDKSWLPMRTFRFLKSEITTVRWTPRDIATIVLIGVMWWMTSRGWMRKRPLRSVWLVSVVLVIGCWTGNLISLALITGWASSGVSWQLAIGLVVVVGTAMLTPPLTRGNPYCNHLCPHGAMQQLVRPQKRSWRHVSLSSRQANMLGWFAPLTLVLAYLCLLFRPAADVSGVEPFHAYLWPMATASSVLLFVVTFLVALCVPMAYCRFACPSGFLIGHLRRSSASDRIGRGDLVFTGLLVFALFYQWQS